MGIANDLREVAAGVVGSDVSGFAPDTELSVTRTLRRDAGYDQTVEYGNHL
tara:strand:- start:468 stop:620 length:153 start_codon:yes stop_codon:yes gene_type:complete